MIPDVENELRLQGYLNRPIDPDLDLVEEILRLKKEKQAVILAHYYQDSDIQDIADYIGDSLGLSQEAARTDARIIVFAGVHFMAEVAKIICPDKKVLLPDLRAGCSLADSAPAEEFRRFREAHPDHVVISYINCSAEVKALSDIICTSSNAEKIIQSVPPEKPIIFAPDKNLGKYLMKKTGRQMLLWNGSCMVHELFSLEKITRLKMRYPDAKLIAHPECEEAILNIADFVGSTTALLRFVGKDSVKTYIVATESGILHQMEKTYPEKTFIPAPPENSCACNNCPHMKLNTLEKLYLCLFYEQPEIVLDEELRLKAYRPLARMLEISAS
ncbi:MAG: quinolinate synthase NadA [Thermoflavifilum sp.]|nr:quinolinate synthase NadA [Thermoflavifilum sp.]